MCHWGFYADCGGVLYLRASGTAGRPCCPAWSGSRAGGPPCSLAPPSAAAACGSGCPPAAAPSASTSPCRPSCRDEARWITHRPLNWPGHSPGSGNKAHPNSFSEDMQTWEHQRRHRYTHTGVIWELDGDKTGKVFRSEGKTQLHTKNTCKEMAKSQWLCKCKSFDFLQCLLVT